MNTAFKGLSVAVLGAAVGVAAAAGAWRWLGHAPVWPLKPELHAQALAVTAGATLLWGVAVWAVLAWAQARSHQARARRARVAELTQQMVLTLDNQGRVDWANAALMRRTDRHGPHVLGRELAQVLGLPDSDARSQLAQAVASGQALDLAVEGTDLHGHPLPMQLELQPLRDARGRPQGAVLIALDGSASLLAEQQQSALQAAEEAALGALYAAQEAERGAMQAERTEMADERQRQTEAQDRSSADLAALQLQVAGGREALERLSSALDGAGMGIWAVELAEGRVQLNAVGVQLLGRALGAELSLMGWLAQVHPDDLPLAREHFAPVMAGAQAHFELPMRVRHGSGHWVPVLLRGGVTQHGATGEPERLAGTVQPQVQALDSLQRQARLLADAEALHGAAAFGLAEPMLMLEASPQLLQLLGLPSDAAVPDWGQLLHYAADELHRQRWQAALDDALASTEAIGWDITLPLRTALGQPKWVRCHARAIDESEDGLRRWVGVMQAVAEPARIDVAVADTEPEPVRIDLVEADPDAPGDGPTGEVSSEVLGEVVGEVVGEVAGEGVSEPGGGLITPPINPPISAPADPQALQREAALRHFGGDAAAYARAGRLLAPILLNLPAQLRQAGQPAVRQQLLRRAEMLSRSLGASVMAEHLQAAGQNPSDAALAALRAEIDDVVDALQHVG